jgi:uridine kinase
MSELLDKKVAQLPVYNFIDGAKSYNNPPTTLKDDEVMIIEGLHALNPIINNFIPQKFTYKVFVCPKTEFVLNEKTVLDVFELRLMRRLIRDVRTRGIEPSQTLYFWKNVREAEDLYVLPFEKEANAVVDTTHIYEPCVYKSILSVLFLDHSEVVQHLLNNLVGFDIIEPKKVPSTSLLKEFVG